MKQSDLESLSQFSSNVLIVVFSQVCVQLPQQPVPAGGSELLHRAGQRLGPGPEERGPLGGV